MSKNKECPFPLLDRRAPVRMVSEALFPPATSRNFDLSPNALAALESIALMDAEDMVRLTIDGPHVAFSKRIYLG